MSQRSRYDVASPVGAGEGGELQGGALGRVQRAAGQDHRHHLGADRPRKLCDRELVSRLALRGCGALRLIILNAKTITV